MHYKLLLATLSCAVSLTYSQAVPVDQISETVFVDNGLYPEVTVDNEGNIHLMYVQYQRVTYRSGTRGLDFGPAETAGMLPVFTSINSSPVLRGSYNSFDMQVDNNNVPHAVFQLGLLDNSQAAIYTNRMEGSWDTHAVVVLRSGNRINYPRLALDNTGTKGYVSAFAAGDVNVGMFSLTSPGLAVKTVETDKNPYVLVSSTNEVIVANKRRVEYYDELLNKKSQEAHEGPITNEEGIRACLDKNDVIHLTSVNGEDGGTVWYTNSLRYRSGKGVINGQKFSLPNGVSVWPEIAVDERGVVYIAYYDFDNECGKVWVLENGLSTSIQTFAPQLIERIRWDCSIAPAKGGGAYIAWEGKGQVKITTIGNDVVTTKEAHRQALVSPEMIMSRGLSLLIDLQSTKSVTLRLTDLNGRNVLTRHVRSAAEIDLSPQAHGMYLLRVADGTRSVASLVVRSSKGLQVRALH